MWVWTKLSSAQWLDAWEERFRGNPNLVLGLLKGGRSVRVEVYCPSRDEAERVRRRFGGSVRRLKRDDWQTGPVVRPPARIRDRLLLTAETDPGELARLQAGHRGRELLSIPAEMAFGTGDHATTASCLRMLVDIARERGWGGGGTTGERVADLGTGSGVLAVAARRLGAGEVLAFDFDPFAVEVARRNAARNRADRVRVEQRDVRGWKPRRRCDVVLANLFSSVLIEALPVLARALAPGGDLVVSGILRDQAWEVFAAAAAHGFGFPRVVRRGKWISARGRWMAELAGAGPRPPR